MDQNPSTTASEAGIARPRVPALYRALVFVAATTAAILALRVLWTSLGPRMPLSVQRVPAFFMIMLGGFWLGHWWTFRTVEPRKWSSIAFSRDHLSARTVLSGAALGAAAVGLPSLFLLAIGWLRIEPSGSGNWALAAVSTLMLLLPAALWEELSTRGYLFTLFREWIGSRRAVVVTSMLFGFLHVANAGATWQSVALVTLAGIFLGSIRVAFDSLYAAWSAHVAWNFVMAGVLHSAVSGFGMDAPNYRTIDAGPDWATGGSWGPEAGFLTAAGLIAGIYLMLRRTRRGDERK